MFKDKQFSQEMDPYIKKNTAIPANKEKTIVVTEQDKTLMILEGESENVNENTLLCEIPLAGIQANDKIDVKMHIDEDNILTVSWTNVKKGKSHQTTMKDDQNLDEQLLIDLTESAAERRNKALAAAQ